MNLAGIVKTDFLPASIKIEYQDLIIYIDPLVVADSANADYIFITHNHADHFSIPDTERLSNEDTQIIGPKSVTKKLKDLPVSTVYLDERYLLDDIRWEVIGSYNLKKGFFNMPLHKRSDDFLGYVISLDTIRIYHAGDNDFIPEMTGLEKN
jgi:L-ascorbate metabolism protein UlaG (beta-lactamase superfamily)